MQILGMCANTDLPKKDRASCVFASINLIRMFKGCMQNLQVSSRRFDDEVRHLVDCGGSDLGFCDMSSKYPG